MKRRKRSKVARPDGLEDIPFFRSQDAVEDAVRRVASGHGRLPPEIVVTIVGDAECLIHGFRSALAGSLPDRVKRLLVAAAVGGFEIAIRRYEASLRGVKELAAWRRWHESQKAGQKKGSETQASRSHARAAKARAMYEAGKSVVEIAAHFRAEEGMPKCSPTTVYRWLNANV